MCKSNERAQATRQDTPRVIEFRDRAACERALSERLASRVREAAGTRQATVVLSGGSTPAGVYRRLSQAELPWANVTFTLSDERWVDEDAVDSNARMVRETLLGNAAREAKFTGLQTGHASPEAGQAACHARLASCHWPAAAVLLGMGTDGHTASLFPDDPGLAAGLDPESDSRCVPARPASAAQARMSLSLRCLLDSELICIMILGQAKREVLRRALTEGPTEEFPIRGILRQQEVPVEVYWAP